MGQEHGHAYEDLLDLALIDILPNLENSRLKLRISTSHSLKGISGNIDHLIEYFDQNEQEWKPYLLFLEKFSDSEAHSRPAFRRHLEEYIQAKVSSVENFGYSSDKTLPIINLIYGTSTGWRDVILAESKRLLQPTIYLPELDFYLPLSSLIDDCIKDSYPGLERGKVRNKIARRIKGNTSFQSFKNHIFETIRTVEDVDKNQKTWITGEIKRSQSIPVTPIEEPSYAYIRRSLTELMILPKATREKVISILESTKQSRFCLGEDFDLEEFRLMELSFVGTSPRKSLTGLFILPSDIMKCLPEGRWLRQSLDFAEDFFFRGNFDREINSTTYLGFLDFRGSHIYDIVLDACQASLSLLEGDKDKLIKYLMSDKIQVETFWSDDEVFQNIYLESIMSLFSYIVRTVLNVKKKDLSSPVLTRLSKLPKSRVDKARRQVITDQNFAESIALGVSRFFAENCPEGHTKAEQLILEEINLIRHWKNFEMGDSSLSYPTIPNILNPQKSMSLIWNRHNQLNSHLLFNPLFLLVYEWAIQQLGEGFKLYGFPSKNDANPLKIVFGNEYDGAEYEFSLVCWNPQKRSLHIFESSSVINFKHTSDKCKELCARIRIVRGLLFSKCDTKFHIIVDGDWKSSHLQDLKSAGWDEVIYGRDFVRDFWRYDSL